MSITRRRFAAGTAAIAAAAVITRPARAQTVIRWGELLPTTHPQVQMIDRIAKEAKEKSSGRIEIQSFPNGQLGSGRDMIEAVVSGALTFTTDGAAALGAVPAAALGDRGALSLARRRAHGEGRRLADPRGHEQGPDRQARACACLPSPITASATSPPAARRSAPPPTWPASSCAFRRSIPSAPWRKPGARAPRR